MVSATSFLLGLAAAAGVLALPTANQAEEPQLMKFNKRSTGYNNGYYYQDYSDGQSDVIYTNGNGGEYNVKWDGNGDFVVGKGWSTGSAQ
jgi:endo-1,4-beta-xylanase